MKVTDYERIATVSVTQLGQMECPKCQGVCDERSPENRSHPKKRREWDCTRCGRGWNEVPDDVESVDDAHESAEEDLDEVRYQR